ncbi:AAA family ATPase [Carnimonas nigrificans]|uniref:AAA family ATPase n=1 Tax=Carnimonas nigrificans TaxID=64323 RepID=UPI000471A013|nr:AAA family ATPase [Carnimonas nigrificans]
MSDTTPSSLQPQPPFPFVAVIGQSELKRALQLALVEPRLGGVLVEGPRGVAKSTLARGLSDFLPANGHFVELPLGATSDRLTGSLDIERALKQHDVGFQAGLFARADQGVLYIDEVNLLDDALVDLLLDVAASGVNRVERDGLSHAHSARFLLIGTMNPEEGDLRPQLADRFGLSVRLSEQLEPRERVAAVRARSAFDSDPARFIARYQHQTAALQQQLNAARHRLPSVTIAEALEIDIAERCLTAGVEGIRADLAWHRAALAHAALEGREHVIQQDIEAVAPLVLGHRVSAAVPPTTPPSAQGGNQNSGNAGSSSGSSQPHSPSSSRSSLLSDAEAAAPRPPLQPQSQSEGCHHTAEVGQHLRPYAPWPEQRNPQRQPYCRQRNGHTLHAHSSDRHGAIDWASTLCHRDNRGQPALRHLVRRPHQQRTDHQRLIILDLSASTLRGQSADAAAGEVVRLATQARHQRHRFALLGFGQHGIGWIHNGRRAPVRLETRLAMQQVGGATPLLDALHKGRQLLSKRRHQAPETRLTSWLFTDGRVTELPEAQPWPGELRVIDSEAGRVRLGRASTIAERLGGHYSLLAYHTESPSHEQF